MQYQPDIKDLKSILHLCLQFQQGLSSANLLNPTVAFIHRITYLEYTMNTNYISHHMKTL